MLAWASSKLVSSSCCMRDVSSAICSVTFILLRGYRGRRQDKLRHKVALDVEPLGEYPAL